jgi:hypothetical protein
MYEADILPIRYKAIYHLIILFLTFLSPLFAVNIFINVKRRFDCWSDNLHRLQHEDKDCHLQSKRRLTFYAVIHRRHVGEDLKKKYGCVMLVA